MKLHGEGGLLRLVMPRDRSPLPWIEVRTKEGDIITTMEISLESSTELIKFVRRESGQCILSRIDIPHSREFREHTCLITLNNDHDNTRFLRTCCLNLRSLVTTSNFNTSNPAILVDYDPNNLRPFLPYIISSSCLFLTDIDVLIYLRRVSTKRSM